MQKKIKYLRSKVSPEFASRLNNYNSKKKIRVIVLLNKKEEGEIRNQQNSFSKRQKFIKTTHNSDKQALKEIEHIIKMFGGRKIEKHPNLLGSMSIEIKASGIKALAASNWIKAIFEDQMIRLIQ